MSMRALYGAILCLALAAAGCGGFDCGDAGKCANDVGPSTTQKASCDARTGDPACGSKYEDYASCYLDNEQCTANGDSDVGATNAACAESLAVVEACCQANPTSAACGF